MSNNAILVNVPNRTANFFESSAKPSEYAVLAEGAYRIPIPWFFCFDEKDLQPVCYEYKDSEGVSQVELTVPITDTQKATSSLNAARDLMREICGDHEIGDGYWKMATKHFVDFHYDFITLDYIDLSLIHI